MRKFFILVMLMSVTCLQAKLPVKILPTCAEERAMLNEADDFIDSMSEGLQDRQGDAILHAMRGMGGELARWRASRNRCAAISANVDTLTIAGDGEARGLSMRLYRPNDNGSVKLPLLVYLHGGGWVLGSLNSCSAFCDAVAATGKAMVLAVDYSLAPEHPSPAAIRDCVAAVQFAMRHAPEWGADPAKVSIGGDSAGGNLALATELWLQNNVGDNKEMQPVRSLVLFYPVVKATNDKSASWKRYSRGYGLDGRLMEAFNTAYLGGKEESAAESPALAPDDVLAKLPPVLMISAERDILCDQGREFAAKLNTLGVKAERVELAGAIHLFITVKGQPTAFAKAVALTSAFLD